MTNLEKKFTHSWRKMLNNANRQILNEHHRLFRSIFGVWGAVANIKINMIGQYDRW